MHTNELTVLKPDRGGLVLPAIPETAAAVEEIEQAHAALAAEHATILRRLTEARRIQAIGVDVPSKEVSEWHAFQATTLRVFHGLRHKAAGVALTACEATIQAESSDLEKREHGIARGLGRMLGDTKAGNDLALKLRRFLGDIPGDHQLRGARNGWKNVLEQSRRALVELPPAPVALPTASEQANTLREMLVTTEKEN